MLPIFKTLLHSKNLSPKNLKSSIWIMINPLGLIFCLIVISFNFLSKSSWFWGSIGLCLLLFVLFNYRHRFPWLNYLVIVIVSWWLIYNALFSQVSDIDYHYSNLQAQVIKNFGNYGYLKIGKRIVLWSNMPSYLIVGQNLVVDGIIKELGPSQNSFSFDFNQYLRTEGIFALLKVETYRLEASNNLRFYFFKWWGNSYSNPLLDYLFLQPSANKVIKDQLVDLNVTYLVHGAILANLFFIKQKISNRLGYQSKTYKSLSCFFLLSLVVYLYLNNWPWFYLRLFFIALNNKIIKYYRWSLNYSTKQFIILIILFFFKPGFILQNSVWYFLLIGLFFQRLNYYKNHFVFANFIKNVILFWPIQIMIDYRINFLCPFLMPLILPAFQFLYGLGFFGWWLPNMSQVWNDFNNWLHIYLSWWQTISFSWNFGSALPLFFYLYFYVWWKLTSEDYQSLTIIKKKILKGMLIFDVCLMLSWSKIVLSPDSLWMLNVGNGCSFVYANKFKNFVMIYDCGAGPNYSPSIMADFLRFKGLNHADLVVISHFHEDHFNGLESVKQTIKIHQLITNEYEGNLVWTVKGFNLKGWKLGPMPDLNDTSLVILLKTPSKNLLFVGDLTKVGETVFLKNQDFVTTIQNTRIDLFQLGHHGSKNASSETFLQLINPRYIFISGGKKNNHQFPDQETIDELKKLGYRFYSTHIKISWEWDLYTNRMKHFF